MRSVLRWLPAVAVATAIYVFSVRPTAVSAQGAGTPLLGMTAKHVIAYAGLAAAIGYGYRFERHRLLRTVLFAAGFGAFVEVHQFFLPYRVFSVLDIAANAVGAAAVMVVTALPAGYRERLAWP